MKVQIQDLNECQEKARKVYTSLIVMNKNLSDDAKYLQKANDVINTINSELTKIAAKDRLKGTKLSLAKNEVSLPNLFLNQLNEYEDCKEIVKYRQKVK